MNDDDFAELFKKFPSGRSAGTSWQDVAAEFAALTSTVGDVLRNAWQRQDDDPGVVRLRESLQGMIGNLNRAVEGTPEAAEARDQLVNLTEAIRATAERASEELRPELVTMLRQANAELRRVTHLDQ